MSEVTKILQAIEHGSADHHPNELLPLVYDELHRLASGKLSNEPVGQTLQTTDLVHEAYVRLLGNEDVSFQNRAHFFAAAAEAMRRILIERARRRRSAKQGGAFDRVDLEPNLLPGRRLSDDQILSLNDALERLEQIAPEKTKLVKLRFFGGFTIRETAELLGISTATAERTWRFTRAWLQKEMQ